MIVFGLIALVGAGYAGYYAYRADSAPSAMDEHARRSPMPGSRDQFAIAGPTLSDAPVPRWN